jgi:hypothetical protein
VLGWIGQRVMSQHDVAHPGLREIGGKILSGSHLYKFYRLNKFIF